MPESIDFDVNFVNSRIINKYKIDEKWDTFSDDDYFNFWVKHVAKFAKHDEKHAQILQKQKMPKKVPISLRNIGRKKNGTKMSRTQLAEKMRKANEHFFFFLRKCFEK